MSVLLIQGPHRHSPADATFAQSVVEGIALKFRSIGSTLEVARCASAADLVRCLKRARDPKVDVVLVDSGELNSLDCARHEKEIRDALDTLSAPYIEIHDRAGCDLEGRVRPSHFALAIVVMTRDLAKGYAVAMGIALRRLRRSTGPTSSDPRPMMEA